MRFVTGLERSITRTFDAALIVLASIADFQPLIRWAGFDCLAIWGTSDDMERAHVMFRLRSQTEKAEAATAEAEAKKAAEAAAAATIASSRQDKGGASKGSAQKTE